MNAFCLYIACGPDSRERERERKQSVCWQWHPLNDEVGAVYGFLYEITRYYFTVIYINY